MRKLLACAAILLLISCQPDFPQFESGKYPFVVDKIETINSHQSKYTAKDYTLRLESFLSIRRPAFIAKSYLYQIGDTVRLMPKK